MAPGVANFCNQPCSSAVPTGGRSTPAAFLPAVVSFHDARRKPHPRLASARLFTAEERGPQEQLASLPDPGQSSSGSTDEQKLALLAKGEACLCLRWSTWAFRDFPERSARRAKCRRGANCGSVGVFPERSAGILTLARRPLSGSPSVIREGLCPRMGVCVGGTPPTPRLFTAREPFTQPLPGHLSP